MAEGKSLHVNYRFVVETASAARPEKGKLLDIGAGKGDVVQLASDSGWDAFGIEFFGPGSGTNIKNVLSERGFLGDIVKEYDGHHIPFPDETFDVLTSNQVFEHVPDLPPLLKEARRVLKNDGVLVFTFPYQGMWREVHSNVFFVHWLKPGSWLRRAWLRMNRAHGKVRLKRNRPGAVWVDFFDEWLVENTFYRSKSELVAAFSAAGFDVALNEDDYLMFRRGQPINVKPDRKRGPLRRLLRSGVRKYAGLTGVARARNS